MLALPVAAFALDTPDFRIQTDDPTQWAALLSAFGIEATTEPAPLRVLTGDSPEARRLGFTPAKETVRVAALTDTRDPDLEIFWETPLATTVFRVPETAEVFVREKRTGAPLAAGLQEAGGGVLWLAVPPGESGYERFPYLVQALVDLGLEPPFRGDRLWAFLDYSYRMRADPRYLAQLWREAGIAALHVGAWPFYDPSPEREAFLEDLIAACHREGTLVYAWLELPHVSEDFWARHPGCREQTARLQDAQLDWRKLVNLAEPSCFERVAEGIRRLLTSFQWDGVNFAELYFESLHGPSNPARFTPLNDWVRQDAQRRLGFDPLALFDEESPIFWANNEPAWRAFADYRAELALSLQERWFRVIREALPQADLVVTQIDDRFDERMRDYLGADAAALLPLAEEFDFTLLIEDPATLWSHGPERYPEIAARYRPLTDNPERLAIDINIVERYQQTYPTRKQVGGELARLVHLATSAFERVALYFERSLGRPDLPLVPHAAVDARLVERVGSRTTVVGSQSFGLAWLGSALVDGKLWPIANAETVWLPAGQHTVEPAEIAPPARVLRLTGDLLSAATDAAGIRFAYESSASAIALVDRLPAEIRVDGERHEWKPTPGEGHWAVRLPRGRREVEMTF